MDPVIVEKTQAAAAAPVDTATPAKTAAPVKAAPAKKASPVKTPVAAKPALKKAVVAPARPAEKSTDKPIEKPAAKPAAKTVAKTVAKQVAKPAAKPAAKPVAKPVEKAAKPVKAEKVEKAAKPPKAAKPAKADKLVRDSFTIPRAEYTLLQELKAAFGLTYLFISHDLNVVRFMSDRVLVMYLGEIVEIGESAQLFTAPRHPYTRALLRSMPSMDPSRRTLVAPLSGDPPNPIDPPPGCAFNPRCPKVFARCRVERPDPIPVGEHRVACHLYDRAEAAA